MNIENTSPSDRVDGLVSLEELIPSSSISAPTPIGKITETVRLSAWAHIDMFGMPDDELMNQINAARNAGNP